MALSFQEETIRKTQAVAGMRIFKTRLPSGDGWHFCAAHNRREAAKKLNVNELSVYSADASEVITIACKALEGLG